jgi:hypothetical protein
VPIATIFKTDEVPYRPRGGEYILGSGYNRLGNTHSDEKIGDLIHPSGACGSGVEARILRAELDLVASVLNATNRDGLGTLIDETLEVVSSVGGYGPLTDIPKEAGVRTIARLDVHVEP